MSNTLLVMSQCCYHIIHKKIGREKKSAWEKTVLSHYSHHAVWCIKGTALRYPVTLLRMFFNNNNKKTPKIQKLPPESYPESIFFIEFNGKCWWNQEAIKVLDTCKYRTRQRNSSIPFDMQFKSGLTKHMQKLSSIKSMNSFINSDWEKRV